MPEWVFQLAGIAGGAVAVYAGIRADLAALHAQVRHAAETADAAHRRLDNLMIGRRSVS
ncbi:MAG: hypothetical protein AB1592_18905 [Pseudomonadota bacterium]